MRIINYLAKTIGIDSVYLVLVSKSLLVILALEIIKVIFIKLFKLIKNEKISYNVTQKFKAFILLLKVSLVIFLWLGCLSKIITLLTFLSAAFTIAIRDIIFNYFSGIYIKIAKPFNLEDRIEINNHKGDVVNINHLNFELLEVNNETMIGQSTGIIIHIPNSAIFNYPLRNYNKGFKYIWNELKINIPLDYDIKKAQDIIYKVVHKNDIIKEIPTKFKKELDYISTDYRIYYNNYDPIIYMEVKDKYVVYTVRYLVHPKKARYVNSSIWKHILIEYQKGNIELYKD